MLFAKPFYRLVHAEADGLPGLIADRFGDVLVLQVNTAGMEALTPMLTAALEDLLAPSAIVFRDDGRMRALEGLEGEAARSVPDELRSARVEENDLTFTADLASGQKTGWYYDQRESRAFVAPLAGGGRMLDAYCYAGGFGIAAAYRGAVEVIGIDSSQGALDLARMAADANGVGGTCTFVKGVAFSELERLGAARERFRVVVADPPAFVKSRKDLNAGLRGYRKLTRLAAALVEFGWLSVRCVVFSQRRAGGVFRRNRPGTGDGGAFRTDHPGGRPRSRSSDTPAPAGNGLPENTVVADRLRAVRRPRSCEELLSPG